MPLSELVYRVAKGKSDSSQNKNPSCSIDPSFVPENDFVELLWENGQIQSSRARKVQSSNILPSQTPIIRDKDIESSMTTKMGKFGTVDSMLNEIPMPVPSFEMGMNQDDDIDPWLNYPINESPRNDYCSEFLPEFSGVTVNEHSSQHNYSSFDKTGANRPTKESHTVSMHNGLSLDLGKMSKVSSAGEDEAPRPKTRANQLYLSPSQQCQASFPGFRSRISADNGDNSSSTAHRTLLADTIHPNAAGSFPGIKLQKQVSAAPATNSSVMNFSHFSRPAAVAKANLQNSSARAGLGIASIERMGSKSKASTSRSSNPAETSVIDSCTELRTEPSSHCHPIIVSSNADANLLEAKPGKEPVPAELPAAVSQEDDSKNHTNFCKKIGENTKGFGDAEKTIDPVVASSSVCSGNSVERVSDDPAQNLKRKNRDFEDSEGPSEDIEEESVGARKTANARAGTGSKRSRAAEVHNLSERRRRDRINEKMRALQELIPNCNKVDKASMLDEAIEYLKTLQLQVQIMSMGTGMYMPSMMLPPGMHHMHAAHMAQFSPMGVGMGMGYGMGMPDMNGGLPGCSMIQMPPMHGSHFPGSPMSGPNAFHGMGGSNLPIYGVCAQGLPMAFPRAPLMPMSGGPHLKTAMGMNPQCSMENLDSAPASSSKDSQNINLQSVQIDGVSNSMNQTSQCQTTNECLEQSSLAQSNGHASGVTESGALHSTNGNKETTGTEGCG